MTEYHCPDCGRVWEEHPFLMVMCAQCGSRVGEPCRCQPHVHRSRKLLAWLEEALCPCMKQEMAETVRRRERRQAKRQQQTARQAELNLFGNS